MEPPSSTRRRPKLFLLNGEQLEGASTPAGTGTATAPAERSKRVLERSEWQRRYATHLWVTDLLVICGAVALAQYVRFDSTDAFTGLRGANATWYSVLLVAAWVLALTALRTRSPRYVGVGVEEYRRLIAASFWTFWVIAVADLLFKLEISRIYLAVAFPAGLLGLVFSRWMWRTHAAQRHVEGRYQTSVLAIGELDAVVDLASELTASAESGYQVVGVCIPGYGVPRGENLVVNNREIPIYGGEPHALEAIRACDADTVAIAGTGQFDAAEVRKLLWHLEPMGVDLVVSPGFMDVAPSRLSLRPIAGLSLLHIEKPQYRDAERFKKRAFDFCFALAALTVALPLMCATALAIKIGSKGPIFYASERIGIDGRPFSMLKFRTMVQGADTQLSALMDSNEGNGLLFKMRSDPRVTPIGRLLRRFSIDELPQFINVLRRDMSVVGPRPPLRREVEAYDGEVQRRLLVKPGITGLWQVGGRSDLPWDKAVRLDLSYVDNWSMTGDLMIIARTVQVVFHRTGAY